jgi:hypothetical protein
MESDAPVRANSKQIIPLEPNHGTQGGNAHVTCHLCRQNMLARGTEAQDGIDIVWGTAEADPYESTGGSLPGAERVVRKGIVVQHSILLAILLVVEGDCDCVSLK